MMQRILIAALAAALSLGPVYADYVIKDGNGTSQTILSGTVSGKILPKSTPTTSAGVEIDHATSAKQDTGNTTAATTATNTGTTATNTGTTNTNLGAPGATACATDTASCSINQFLQRIAQRLSSLITAIGTPLQAGGNVVVTSAPTTAVTGTFFQATQPVSVVSLPLPTGIVADPCQANAKVSVPISQTVNTKLFNQVSAKKNYICSIVIVGADAENISLVEGTGSTCGTSTAAIIGGATAATGPNLSANGGFSMGSGVATVASGANNNFDVCLFQSGSGRVAGVLTYVQQ